MKCESCGGDIQSVAKAGEILFYHCRPCKLPHDKNGKRIFKPNQGMDAQYNPLKGAHEAVKKDSPQMTPQAKAMASIAFMPALQDAYLQGVKDGILLAYSQDVKEGEPIV